MSNADVYTVPSSAPGAPAPDEQTPSLIELAGERERIALDRVGQMRASSQAALSTDPDTHAKAMSMASKLGVSARAATSAIKTDPAHASLLEYDWREIAQKAPALSRWLSHPDNFAVARDDVNLLRSLDATIANFKEPAGNFQRDLLTAGQQGFRQLEKGHSFTAFAFGNITKEQLADQVIAQRQDIAYVASHRPKYLQDYAQRQTDAQGAWDYTVATFSDPAAFIVSNAEQLANMFPGLLLGGALAPAGAAIGGEIGLAGGPAAPGTVPLGAVVGGLVGLGTGVGIGSAFTNFGSWFEQALETRGVNFDDRQSILDGLSDPALVASAQSEAKRYGLTVGSVDGFSATIGGALFAPAKGLIGKAIAGVAETGIQAGLGGISEVAGQTAAYGDISKVNVKDVVAEALAEVPGGAAEITMGTIIRHNPEGSRPIVAVIQKAVQAEQDAKTLQGIAEQRGESKTASRAPSQFNDLVDIAADGQGISGITVDRRVMDEYWQGLGKSPAQEFARIVPGGAESYHTADGPGTLTFPVSAFDQEFAGTPGMDTLLPHARVIRADGEGMTLAEAGLVRKTIETEVQSAVEHVSTLFQSHKELFEQVASLDAQIPKATEQERPALVAKRAELAVKINELTQTSADDATRIEAHIAKTTADIVAANPNVNEREARLGASLQARLIQTVAKIPGAPASWDFEKLSQRFPLNFGELPADETAMNQARLALQADKDLSPAALRELYRRGLEQIGATDSKEGRKILVADKDLSPAQLRKLYKRALDVVAKAKTIPGSPKVYKLEQAGDAGARGGLHATPAFGQAAAGGQRKFTMGFFATADRSTFLHELGHYWLEVMGDLAADEGAPQQIKDDYAKVLTYLGVDSREKLGREQHETWARSFEKYLAEGKAPSAAVRSMFATFKSWLADVYRDLKGLGVTLTDDVRAVMDRIVASEDEIAAAQVDAGVDTLFPDAPAGMTAEAHEAYLASFEKAKEDARTTITRQLMADQSKAAHKIKEARLGQLREQLGKEFDKRPEVKALAGMQEGTIPKIDHASVEAAFPDKPAAVIALSDLGVLTNESGVPVSEVAEALGYNSADALVTGLQLAGSKDRLVDAEARRRFKLEHPELMGTEKIRKAAHEATVNKEWMDVQYAELRELRKLAETKPAELAGTQAALGLQTQNVAAAKAQTGELKTMVAAEAQGRRRAFSAAATQKFLAGQAEAQLAKTPYMQLRPAAFLATARREVNASAFHTKAGKFQDAAFHKTRAILNFELFRQATKLRDEFDQHARFARRMENDRSQRVLGLAGHTYQDNANDILDRYSFRRLSEKELKAELSLADWVKEREEEGFPVDIAPDLLDRSKRAPYQTLTIGQMRDVNAALQQIWHLASTKDKLLKVAKQREVAKVSAAAAEQIRSSRPAFPVAPGEPTPTPIEAGLEQFGRFMGAAVKVSRMARNMDNFLSGGKIWDTFVRPANEAVDDKKVRMRKAATAWQKIMRILPDFQGSKFKPSIADVPIIGSTFHKWKRREAVPGVAGLRLSHEDRMGIMSLWGSVTGRQRLANNGVTQQVAQAVIAMATKEDVAYLKASWQFHEDFWPEIVEKWRRVTGISPEHVELAGYSTPHGDVAGGYFPLRPRGNAAAKFKAVEQADMMKRAATMKMTTRRGYGVERVEKATYKPRYDIGVVSEHVSELLHDLTHHEMLIDMGTLMRRPEVREAITETYGNRALKRFEGWYEDIAAGGFAAQKDIDRGLNYLRGSTAGAMLGFKMLTGVKQLTGIAISARYLASADTPAGRLQGARYIWNASAKWMRHPVEYVRWVRGLSDFMANRVASNIHRDIGATSRNELSPRRAIWREMAGWAIEYGQMMVDMPTWGGAYEKAYDDFKESGLSDAELESKAISVADQAVRDTQGSADVVDLSAVQRGSAAQKLLTLFYFYGNIQANELYEAGAKLRRQKTPSQVAGSLMDATTSLVLPAAMSLALTAMTTGGGPDDPDDWWAALCREVFGDLFGTIVPAREISGMIKGVSGYSGPAVFKLFPEAASTAERVADGNFDPSFRRHALMTIGLLTGLPAQAINNAIDGLEASSNGDAPPWAFLFGPPRD